jgi:hypothetical protein
MWEALMQKMLASQSLIHVNWSAEDALKLVMSSAQYSVLVSLRDANDLDVVHRTCANELGLTEKVAELDAWIANKARRKAENGG